MEELSISTQSRVQVLDITSEVSRVVRESGIRDGICLVSCPHTTAGIAVQEHADPDVVRDLGECLGRMAPREAGWHHREGNADSHVKSTLVGPGQTLPVSDGGLVLGTWQGVFFCEFDGPRRRSVHVQVVGL